jgi:hypothetical protein
MFLLGKAQLSILGWETENKLLIQNHLNLIEPSAGSHFGTPCEHRCQPGFFPGHAHLLPYQ